MQKTTDIADIFGSLHKARASDATICEPEALRYLGYTGQTLDAALKARIDAQFAAAQEKLCPTFTWKAFRIFGEGEASRVDAGKKVASPKTAAQTGKGGGGLILDGSGIILTGRSIAAHLKGAVGAAVLAVTLGFDSERTLDALNAASPTDALIYSAAASTLVEAGADAACGQITQAARDCRLYTGLRYSPGYGDLSLNVQPQIASALSLQKTLGVSLTKDNMLMPIKSMTAIVGLFTKPNFAKYESGCNTCHKQNDCPLKAKGLTCYAN